MRIGVRNAGNRTIPEVAVTVQAGTGTGTGSGSAAAFAEASTQRGPGRPSRPVWILDAGPRGGTTAFVNTPGPWARLRPGQTKTFTWKVTAVKPGVHILRYRVAAGLNGKATAVLAGGGEASGSVRRQHLGPPDEVGAPGPRHSARRRPRREPA